MRADNHSRAGHVIIAAYSPIATQAEFHTVIAVEGKPVNVKIHAITLPLSTDFMLSSRHKHIEFLGLKRALHAGDVMPITLIFRDGSYQTLNVTVH